MLEPGNETDNTVINVRSGQTTTVATGTASVVLSHWEPHQATASELNCV